MNTRTSHIFRLALMLTGIVVIMLPSCGKRYDSNHAGKYAGREVCAVCEEITQEEFAEALEGKSAYNIYPTQKALTDKSFANVRRQISTLFDSARVHDRNITGHKWTAWQPDILDRHILYYPDCQDYLAGTHSRQNFNEMVNGSFWETYPY